MSEILCVDLAVLSLEKEVTLKLRLTKTSFIVFMGKTEFLQVHSVTELTE